MEVTLAKALKLKNRQTQQLAALFNVVTAHNSRLVGSTVAHDVRAVYAQIGQEMDRLVAIKTAISLANAPIQDAIYRAAEVKGMIAMLRRLPTTNGRIMQPYGMQEPQEYEAVIDALEVEKEVQRLEAELDDLQDRLDAHNASVRVILPD